MDFAYQSKRHCKCSACKREEKLKKQAPLPQTHHTAWVTIQVQNLPGIYVVPQSTEQLRCSPRLCVEGLDSAHSQTGKLPKSSLTVLFYCISCICLSTRIHLSARLMALVSFKKEKLCNKY